MDRRGEPRLNDKRLHGSTAATSAATTHRQDQPSVLEGRVRLRVDAARSRCALGADAMQLQPGGQARFHLSRPATWRRLNMINE